MSWNYRVIEKSHFPIDSVKESVYYEIHEAYYHPNEDIPHTLSSDPVSPYGETMTELMSDLEKLKEACNNPILKWTDIVKGE